MTTATLPPVNPHLKPGLPPVHGFGTAPQVVPKGYRRMREFRGTAQAAQELFKGQHIVLVQGAELEDKPGHFVFGVFSWLPCFEKWRHGGWYVTNVRYPSGAIGCVSNNYSDRKWRIVCDDRRTNLGEPGDFTFKTRDAAARAELELVNAL